eukprot:scaffold301_cov243-Pinguiococcus_pyrenoidosus.AAC.12
MSRRRVSVVTTASSRSSSRMIPGKILRKRTGDCARGRAPSHLSRRGIAGAPPRRCQSGPRAPAAWPTCRRACSPRAFGTPPSQRIKQRVVQEGSWRVASLESPRKCGTDAEWRALYQTRAEKETKVQRCTSLQC